MRLFRASPAGRTAFAFVLAVSALLGPAAPVRARVRPEPHDPLLPLVRRIDRYFQQHEVEGVVLDSRYAINPTEAVRLSVIPQLLAYAELHKVHPARRLERDIVQRADFLIDRFADVHSGTVFDGMLGQAFFEAFQATGDRRYLEKGEVIVEELKAIRRSEYVLNGGLMAAMAFAKYHQLTGDPESERLAREILAGLPSYQHPDGSFPHWCPCSRDVHYTDWMATELILIGRMLDDPAIEPMLQKMLAFVEARVDGGGVTRYEAPCVQYPGCVTYYYSLATGCDIDYDTRGFTNEVGYTALLFDHFHAPQYRAVMGFLGSLENGGTFRDKWDYWIPPDDHYYVWTSADTSVVNMSLILWSLACVESGRRERERPGIWNPDGDAPEGAEIVSAGTRLPALGSAARVPWWTAVDSLLLAGANPAYYCDEDPGPGVPQGDPLPPGRSGGGRQGRALDPGTRGSTPSAGLRLGSVAPNLSRNGCTLSYSLPGPARVSLAIYDAGGRRVLSLVSETLGAGDHSARWDGRDEAGRRCANGLYFALLRAGDAVRTARVPLIH